MHKGEEPVISGDTGICNVFFSHCNLQCVYCQNYQISRNNIEDKDFEMSTEAAVDKIRQILDKGISRLGFVSPTHQTVQMMTIINRLHQLNYSPVVVYNSNGYEKVSTLKQLEPFVDIYLPDFKYADDSLGEKLSKVPRYSRIAINAIAEMIRQKGNSLLLDKNGLARQGVIIRHLVLPGYVENSIDALHLIRKHFGTQVTISVMSQYFPPDPVKNHPELGRKLFNAEYEAILQTIDNLGFENGFIQEMDSAENYIPDFDKENPFVQD